MNAQSEKPQDQRTPQPNQSKGNQLHCNNDVPSIVSESNRTTSEIATEGPAPQKSPQPSTEPTKNPRNNYDWTKFFPNGWTAWLLVLFNGLLALFTFFLWHSTENLWKSGQKQIAIARDAADAAKKSADVADKTLIATQRPWISVKKGILSGFVFNEQGATTAIRFKIKNVGKSPAIGIYINALIFPLSEKRTWIDEQRKIFAAVDGMKPIQTVVGYTLFPDDDFTIDVGLTLSWADIKQGHVAIESKRNIIWPVLVGCVYYRFVSDESIHKTGFVADIGQFDPKTNSVLCIDTDAGDVPVKMLRLENVPLGAYAD